MHKHREMGQLWVLHCFAAAAAAAESECVWRDISALTVLIFTVYCLWLAAGFLMEDTFPTLSFTDIIAIHLPK